MMQDNITESVARDHLYPLCDWVPVKSLRDLGFMFDIRDPSGMQLARERGKMMKEVRAVWTGEKRKPKAGEWYLSGSIVGAYLAQNGMSSEYHIARLVRVEKVEYYRIVAEIN